MIKLIKPYFLVFALFFIFGCTGNGFNDLKPGDVCSIENDSASFGVMKILAIEDSVFHIKIYRNKYPQRPEQTEISELTIEPDTANLNFGIPHLALTKNSFSKWKPKFIRNENVTEEEVTFLNIWKTKQINNK